MLSMRVSLFASALLTLAFPLTVSATTFYVSDGIGDDANNGQSWATAKKTIQAGVDIAANGDAVLVTNGTYVLTNQISISNAVSVQSVNGAESTTVNGNSLVRCFYISHPNASLDGFTIRGGYTATDGAGVYLEGGGTVEHCAIVGNLALGWGGGVQIDYAGVLNDCVVSNNVANDSGGGVAFYFGGMATNCSISWNSSIKGGGVFGEQGGVIANTQIDHNLARITNIINVALGGGACGSSLSLNDCSVFSNRAESFGNVVNLRSLGGGAYLYGTSTVQNVAVHDNVTEGFGGGLYLTSASSAKVCVVANNTAGWGGGIYVTNSFLYDSSVIGNVATSSGGGVFSAHGVVTNCQVSGNTANGYGGGGCYGSDAAVFSGCTVEDNAGPFFGFGGGLFLMGNSLLSNSVVSRNDGSGIVCIQSIVDRCTIDSNTNGSVYVRSSVQYTRVGGGILLIGSQLLNSKVAGNKTRTYQSGSAAGATSASALGGGIYSDSGTIRNCLITGNFVVADISFSEGSIIGSKQYMANGAGIYATGTVVESSTIMDNMTRVNYSGPIGPSTDQRGGGACITPATTIRNCIVYENHAGAVDTINDIYGIAYGVVPGVEYTCSTSVEPWAILPADSGNVTAPPMLDPSNHLLLGSPCINTGANQPWMAETTDLDDNPRIMDGMVDMGAYEFDSQTETDLDGDGLPNDWEEEYFGGPTNANPNALCANGTHTALQAFIAGLDPADPAARFALHLAQPLSWNSASGRQYTVYRTTNLLEGFQPLQTGLVGGSFTDVVHGAELKNYYKIGVDLAP